MKILGESSTALVGDSPKTTGIILSCAFTVTFISSFELGLVLLIDPVYTYSLSNREFPKHLQAV